MLELRGKNVSDKINEYIEQKLLKLSPYIPTLAIVRVGDRADDIAYEKSAIKKLEAIGLQVKTYVFDEKIENENFINNFLEINKDSNIDGILIFKPLPTHIDSESIDNIIDERKDMDGISPVNMAKLFKGDKTAVAPCTARAVIELLKFYGIELGGKNIVIVGRSMVVGRPLALLALKEDATVTICHSKTRGLKNICKNADIIVLATGKPNIINSDYTKDDAIIIDVGINFDSEGKLCGDADFTSFINTNVKITPVPKGVGTVTTSVLALHLIESALKNNLL